LLVEATGAVVELLSEAVPWELLRSGLRSFERGGLLTLFDGLFFDLVGLAIGRLLKDVRHIDRVQCA
jgi:hypothetical protein